MREVISFYVTIDEPHITALDLEPDYIYSNYHLSDAEKERMIDLIENKCHYPITVEELIYAKSPDVQNQMVLTSDVCLDIDEVIADINGVLSHHFHRFKFDPLPADFKLAEYLDRFENIEDDDKTYTIDDVIQPSYDIYVNV